MWGMSNGSDWIYVHDLLTLPSASSTPQRVSQLVRQRFELYPPFIPHLSLRIIPRGRRKRSKKRAKDFIFLLQRGLIIPLRVGKTNPLLLPSVIKILHIFKESHFYCYSFFLLFHGSIPYRATHSDKVSAPSYFSLVRCVMKLIENKKLREKEINTKQLCGKLEMFRVVGANKATQKIK